jgi:DNA repair exonuclease SbcCD ATPase subunit
MRTANNLVADIIAAPEAVVLLAELLVMLLETPETVVQALDKRSLEDGYRFVDACASTAAGSAALALLVTRGVELESRNFERRVAETVAARAASLGEELERRAEASGEALGRARAECERLAEGLHRLASLRAQVAAERERLEAAEAQQAEIERLERRLELASVDADTLAERIARLRAEADERDAELETLRAECGALEASLEARKREIEEVGSRRSDLADENDALAAELRERARRVSPEVEQARKDQLKRLSSQLDYLEAFGKRLTNIPPESRELQDLHTEVEYLQRLLGEDGLRKRIKAVYTQWEEIKTNASAALAAAEREGRQRP